MAIDPSIALGIRPLQLADPLAQYSQFAQIQNAQNQNALAQYQLGAAQRAEEMDQITGEAYKNALTSEGGINYNLLAANLSRGGAGKLVPAVLAAKAEQEVKTATLSKTRAETEELERKSREAKVKALGTGLLRGMSNPDDATLESIFGDLDSNGIDTKNIRQQFSQIPDLKARQNVIRNYALSNQEGRQALEFVSPKTEKFDLDGKVVVFDLNPNSPTYKKEITGFEKTVSPSAQLSADVAFRGQNVAAATAERGQDIGAATAAAGQASVAETAAAKLAADVKNWDRMDLLARDQLAAQIENWNNLDARAKATLQEIIRSTNLQDARARAVLSETIRNNNLQDARSRASLAEPKYNAERGGFVYPPNKENPEGRFVPLTGGDGKPLTEAQGNSTAYGMRMTQANQIIEKLASEGTNRAAVGAGAPYGVGGIVNAATASPQQQQFQQAKLNFITAILRKESGAAIGQDEFEREDQKYFPQVRDSDAVKAQKAQARQTAIEAMKIQAGPGAKEIQKFAASGGTPAAPSGPPKIGSVQEGYKFKGGDPANPKNWEKQ